MNAFTKNELEIIRNSLGMATYEACEESGFDILYDKIRSMIDNYCEHSPDFGYALHYTTPKCNKCGKFY